MAQAIPKWVTIASILITLLGLFVGGSLYYSPGASITGVDFSTKEVLLLAHMWAARQVAIALIIGYAVFRQSAPMLKISLIAYCLMTFQDVFIGVAQKDGALIGGSALFSILSAAMIYALGKKRN